MRGRRSESAVVRRGVRVGLLALAGAAAGIATHFARQVLTPAAKPDAEVQVVELESSELSPTGLRVWLRGPDADLDGEYSFIFDAFSRHTQHLAGHIKIGTVVQQRSGLNGRLEVARNVVSIDRGDLRVGARGRVTGWWFHEPEELGYAVRKVSLPMPDGVGPAWVISPTRPVPGRWAVHVHGRGSLPQETLRGVVPFAEAGYTNLVVSYRNDPGAPAGRGGRYGLGLAEQLDVDSAIGWARGAGATSVVVVGWSMGGCASLLAAAHGTNAELIKGLVLDSPAIDWPGLLRAQARLSKVPMWIADFGRVLLQMGLVKGAVPGTRATDVAALTVTSLISNLRVPTLIHASAGDTYVPWQGALRAAQMKPRLVRLNASKGEHVKLWNVNPRAWHEETAKFISELETLDSAVQR